MGDKRTYACAGLEGEKGEPLSKRPHLEVEEEHDGGEYGHKVAEPVVCADLMSEILSFADGHDLHAAWHYVSPHFDAALRQGIRSIVIGGVYNDVCANPGDVLASFPHVHSLQVHLPTAYRRSDVRKMIASIADHRGLRELSIVVGRMDSEVLRKVFDVLGEVLQRRELDCLSITGWVRIAMSEDMVRGVAAARLRRLILPGKFIPVGMSGLEDMFTTVRELELDGVSMEHVGPMRNATLLHTLKIKLERMDLTMDGLARFTDMFREGGLPQLHTLEVANASIYHETGDWENVVRDLAHVLHNRVHTLTWSTVSFRRNTMATFLRTLLDASSSTIRVLTIAGVKSWVEGIEVLADIPEVRLETLGLPMDFVTPEQFQLLTSAMFGWKSMRTLNFSGCRLTSKDIIALSRPMETAMRALEHVDLRSNHCSTAACRALASALVANPAIRTLDLRHCLTQPMKNVFSGALRERVVF